MTIQEYIRQAIAEQKNITIEYIKYEGTKSIRTLSNVQYSDKFGTGYISGFCHKRQEERTFKISRIQSVDGISARSMPINPSSTKTAYSAKSAYTTSPKAPIPTQAVSSTHSPLVRPTYKTTQQRTSYSSAHQKRNEGCYIATMAYGDYDHPQVIILRRIRDERLLTTSCGTLFVSFYYWISPKLVKLMAGHWRVNCIIRHMLDGFIKLLN